MYVVPFFLVSLSVIALLSAENLRGAELEDSIELDGIAYSSRAAFSQTGGRCRTPDLTADELLIKEMEMNAMPEAMFETEAAAKVINMVRVFFHIITSSSGVGGMTQKRIDQQIAVMNRAYEGSLFQFTLADVTTTKNDGWFNVKMGSAAEINMKRSLRKGAYKDLNIYTTAQTDSTLGWATFPGKVGPDFRLDGVVVDHRTLPGSGTFAPYNLGQTVTHESGHWFGLQHTFNGGCTSSLTGGDQIADTPAEATPNFGCPASRNTCPGNTGALAGNDPYRNYMDYSDDACMNNFTPNQRQRIKKQWKLYRA